MRVSEAWRGAWTARGGRLDRELLAQCAEGSLGRRDFVTT